MTNEMTDASEPGFERFTNLPAGTYRIYLIDGMDETCVSIVRAPGVADALRAVMEMYDVPLSRLMVWLKI